MPDLAEILEKILLTTDAHQITNIFLILIIGVFLISLILATFGKASVFTRNTSGLLTSLGILGTFIGIVIGLLDFNPKQIDESIELLLSGLKTAFITSLAGMATAILYKLIGSTKIFKDNRGSIIEIIDVEPRDILNAIKKQDKNLNLINAHLGKLLKAIGGNNDSSLVSQIKLLRADVNDNHKNQQKNFNIFSDELWANLKEFSEMLSKSATEQVMQALKDVIADFNENLTEQFGDNFKALDASVKKLVDWQDSYRIQLEEMDKQYSHSVQAITVIEKSVSQISEELKEIPTTMASLKDVLETNQHQINELENHLNAFKEVKEQAVQAFPEIQKHIDKTIKDIALSSQKASDGYNLLIKNTESVQKTVVESIETIQDRLEKSVSELVEKQISEMNKAFLSLEDGNNLLIKNTENTQKTVVENIETIQSKLEQSISDLVEKQIFEMSKSFTLLEDGNNLLIKNTESVQETVVESIETIQDRLEKNVSELVEKQISEMNKAFLSLENGNNLLIKNTESVQKIVVESIETIQDRLEKSVSELVEKQIFEMNKSFTSLEDGNNLLIKNTESIQKTVVESIETIQDRLEKSISKLVEKQIYEMNKAFSSLEDGNNLLIKNTESTQKSVVESIETIQDKLEKSVSELVEKQIYEMNKAFSSLEDGNNLLLRNNENVQTRVVGSIEIIQDRLEKSVSGLVEKQIFEMNKSFTSLEDEVTKSVNLTGQAVNKQLEMMDETMSQEVNRVMTEMGSALARISGQFTDDYQELINAMARITGRR